MRCGRDVDGVFAGAGTARRVEVVAHGAERGVEVEPRRDTGANADFDRAACRLRDDLAPLDGIEPYVAVRTLRRDRSACAVDDNIAVRGVDPEIADDVVDRGV